MKKLLTPLLILSVFATVNAQSYEGKGDSKLNFGYEIYGIGPGIKGSFDYGLSDLFSVGGGATYYFDNEGSFPLYELIIEYESTAARDAEADRLFGSPNFEETEWQYDSKEGFLIHAWKFKNKLVIAGKIAGTEWDE